MHPHLFAAPASSGMNNYHHMDQISHFRKTVSLREWWLIKHDNGFEGKRLAVAGFTCGEQQPLRVFRSAPITKTLDIFTLQTADGITVILQGYINRKRTTENGFPSEVFDHFLFGFPPSWDVYAENHFKQDLDTALDSVNTSASDELNTDPGVRVTHLMPISSPGRCMTIVESGQTIKGKKDSCHVVAEKFTSDASNISNLNNDAAGWRGLVLEKLDSATPSDMIGGTAEISVSQNESHDFHPCLSASPLDNHVDDKNNYASQNLSPPACGLTNAVRSMDDNMAVESGAPCSHAVESSERIDHSKSFKKSKRSSKKSRNKRSASLERVSVRNDALEEPLAAKGASMDNLDDSNFNLVLALTVSNEPKSSKNTKNQNEGNKDGMKSRNTNFLAASFPQDPETLPGSVNEEEVTHKDSLFRLPAVGDSCNREQSSDQIDFTIMSSTNQHDTNMNGTKVKRGSRNASISNFGLNNCSYPLENKKSVKHKIKRQLKRCSNLAVQSEFSIQQPMLRAAKGLRNLSEILKSKEKNEQIFVKGGSSTTKARRKIMFDTPVKRPTQKGNEQTCIKSPESFSLKRSRSGRLLLPTLEFWRNQIPLYDADRNVTGIQEELGSSHGTKSEPQKKQKRRR